MIYSFKVCKLDSTFKKKRRQIAKENDMLHIEHSPDENIPHKQDDE